MGLTYNGTTAGTTLANPPVELDAIVGGKFVYACTAATTDQPGGKLWMYSSTNDITDLVALNAINDGLQLGIAPGDVLIHVSATALSTSPKLQFGVFAFPATAATTGICLSSNILSSTAV